MSDSPKTKSLKEVAAEAAAMQPPAAPMIIDLGKQRRKAVRDLGKGRGRLLDKINGHLTSLTRAGEITEGAQPVIVLVKAKKKKRRIGWF